MKRQKRKTINQGISIALGLALFFLLEAGFQDATLAQSIPMRLILENNPESNSHRSLPELEAALRKNPYDVSTRFHLIDEDIRLGHLDKAKALSHEAYQRFPKQMTPLLMDARIAFGLIVDQDNPHGTPSELQTLIGLRDKAIRLDPDHPGSHYLAGIVAKWQGENTLSENELLKALYLAPQYLKAQQALIDLYLDDAQPQLASPLLIQAMDEDPQNADTLYLLGRLFSIKAVPEKALTYLQASHDIDPMKRFKRLLLKGDALSQLSRLTEAQDAYTQALGLQPDNTDLMVKLAQVDLSHGDEDSAMALYRQAYQLNPSVLNQFITQAEQALWTKSLSDALPAYQRILKLSPENEDALVTSIGIGYRLWEEEKQLPASASLEQWESWLRQQQESNTSDKLTLADIQLQVLLEGHWTPGLNDALNALIQSSSSKEVQAMGLLMQDKPKEANTLFRGITTPSEITTYALLGAWPWVLDNLSNNKAMKPYRTWLSTLSEKDREASDNLISESKANVVSNQLEQALATLHRAQLIYPLSAPVQVQYASLHLNQNLKARSKADLATAQTLDPDIVQTTDYQAIAKVLGLIKSEPKHRHLHLPHRHS